MDRPSKVWVCLAVCLVASMATIGCGVGSNVYPPATGAVAATQHPLVAQYTVTIPQKGATAWAEFGTDTKYGRKTSATATTTTFGTSIHILVAGMLPGTTYHMRAHIDDMSGSELWVDQDRTFKAGALPTSDSNGPITYPTFVVSRPNSNLTPQPGVELFNLSQPAGMYSGFVSDLNGNIIWYYDAGAGNSVFPMRQLPNGHFLVNISKGLGGLAIREIDLAGNTIREVSLDSVTAQLGQLYPSMFITAFHHDVLQLPNGHWIILANGPKLFTDLPGYPGVTQVTGDYLVDVDTSGNVVWAWSTFDHLDVNRHPMQFPDWTHSNAILYSETDGNLLLSIRHQSWIIKIDYANGAGAGDIIWKLGYQGDFALRGGTDPNDWQYAQHFPQIISSDSNSTKIVVMDNGDTRAIDDNGDRCGTPNPDCYTRAVVFDIDEASKVVTQDWQYLPGVYSYWGGDAQQLANGNIEFDMSQPGTGVGSLVTETTQDANPQVVWQLSVQGAYAYRGYRIPSMYPDVTWQQ